MKILLTTIFILFTAVVGFAAQELCRDKNINSPKNLKNISSYINEHPVVTKNISGDSLKKNSLVVTQENEYVKITFLKPFKVEFDIYPNTSLELTHQSTTFCGPKIKLIQGKIISTGKHPIVDSSKPSLCNYELETVEAYIEPLGTTYIAETGALSDALAELNGETPGTAQENFSVERGVISVKLKKISKIKAKNKIKYVKNLKTKTKTKFLARNEKIKLRKGSKLKITRNKKSKKTQTADLEVIDPYTN